MILKDVLSQLDTATHPVAKALYKGDGFKALAIGFKKGMTLADHKANLPSKLTVLSGRVVYRQDGTETSLQQYDEIDIPVGIMHAVSAEEDSLCLLTQG